MAAFMVGKSLKDRRQTKAIEELFDRADKNGNGRISIQVKARSFKAQLFMWTIFLDVCQLSQKKLWTTTKKAKLNPRARRKTMYIMDLPPFDKLNSSSR